MCSDTQSPSIQSQNLSSQKLGATVIVGSTSVRVTVLLAGRADTVMFVTTVLVTVAGVEFKAQLETMFAVNTSNAKLCFHVAMSQIRAGGCLFS